jgi:hypothetical protein
MTKQQQSSFSPNTHCDLPCLKHTLIFLLQHTIWSSSKIIFFQHSPQSLGYTKLTTSCSSTSCQCCDPPSPCDASSVNQKKQMEGVAMQHGMNNVGVVYISPCHWSVSKMKVCDWWARSQWQQVQPLPQHSPTHKVWGGARSPWVPMCSFKGNGSWPPTQSSVILGCPKIQLSGHSLRCSNTTES